jgi:hypothetical protein
MCPLCIRLSPILTHGVALHLDAVGIVNEPVKNAIGECRIANPLVRRVSTTAFQKPTGSGPAKLLEMARLE